jgi:hypothetical protein
MSVQVRLPCGGQQDEDVDVSRITSTYDETSSIGVFPDRKTWARRAPRVEYLGVRAGRPVDPLEEIDYEGLDGVGQRDLPPNGFEPVTRL